MTGQYSAATGALLSINKSLAENRPNFIELIDKYYLFRKVDNFKKSFLREEIHCATLF